MTTAAFQFGDHRLNVRANRICQRLREGSANGFPQIFRQQSELEGFYRFVHNRRVEALGILEPFFNETVGALCDETLVLHDTSVFRPGGRRRVEGLSEFQPGKEGFLGHFSIAVSTENRVLGLLDVRFWMREQQRNRKQWTDFGVQRDPQRESLRWFEQAAGIESRVTDDEVSLIHVMDREADAYWLFSEMHFKQMRFVIRLAHDRRIENADHKLFERLRGRKPQFKRDVVLTRIVRMEGTGEKQRKKGTVKLHCRSATVDISRAGHSAPHYPKSLPLNVVHVREAGPPLAEKPIEWFLVTTEPVDTQSEIEKVIDIYRRRWLIEEYFKALKTGCRAEQKLLGDIDAWMNVVALCAPVAANIVNLRVMDNNLSAKNVLGTEKWKILCALAVRDGRVIRTLEDAKLEIAHLGGHIKRAGPPGWLVLHRGFSELLAMEAGWRLAHRNM